MVGLTKIINGYVEMFPELARLVDRDALSAPLDHDETPRGAEAVRIILQDQPNVPWLVSELVNALDSRGWLPESTNPANAVRTALERLVAAPESDVVKGTRSGKVIYSYEPDRITDPPPYYRGNDDEEPF